MNLHQPPYDYSRGEVERNNQGSGRTIQRCDKCRGNVERNNQISGRTKQNDDDAAIESRDFGSQMPEKMKYRRYT